MKSKLPVTTLFVFLSLLLTGAGCHKNDTATGGGKGGNATLIVTPVHLGVTVDSCTIYVKYATLDAPANNIYDDSQKVHLMDTTPVAVFSNLKTGNYYIFGNGYHARYFSYVKGGISITIKAEDSISILLPTSPYLP